MFICVCVCVWFKSGRNMRRAVFAEEREARPWMGVERLLLSMPDRDFMRLNRRTECEDWRRPMLFSVGI